jgi:type IV pilus assembly protein PilP
MATPRRTVVLILLACAGLFAPRVFAAEESIRTPSDQMKDAVGKVGKAPASIGKSLQDLTDAAKEKLRGTFGTKSNQEVKPAPSDLTLPKKTSQAPAPAVKMDESQRDPFRPMTLRGKTDVARKRENLSPLERLELSQLKLVGIVWDTKDPRAMVEDSGGLGYVVKVGTPIGTNDGKVKAIYRNEVVVEELYSDDYGARKKRDVGIKLMTD